MRAVVVERYGGPDAARVAEVSRPEPGRDDVLVRVAAAAVTSGDARMRAARFPPGFALPSRLAIGLRGPRRRVLGATLSGTVESIGGGVTGFAVGDAVCTINGARMGAHAELVAVKAERLARLPDGVTHEQAAGILFGGTTALHYLRNKGRLRAGMRVLVNGASGAVGTAAVQLARHAGATVTAVTSAANTELVTSLGAEEVIDYRAKPLDTLDQRFDIVLDTVGNLDLASGRRLLADGGRLLLVVASLGQMLRARGDAAADPAPERVADYDELLALVAAGDLTVVVSRTFPLDEIADAYRLIDSGHKVGNILVLPGGHEIG